MPRILELVDSPPFLPVSVDDAKLHLRIDSTDEDAILRGFIESATEYVENATDRQLITASYAYSFDRVPCDRRVELPKSPLVSVGSITYIDADGQLQTLSPSAYRAVLNRTPAHVHFISLPPSLSCREDAITITYAAGYGNPEDVPFLLQMAIKQLVGTWYANRESVVDRQLYDVPAGVDRILDSYRVGGIKWVGSTN
jgi:uncharacterized phiE125 gp8 family phage protein